MSGVQHLGWEALERIRTDEASSDEFAHLATCAACRDALADLERLASRFKESFVAGDAAIPAAREDAILAVARERAAAIAGKKLVRLPWWKQRSTMALAASLVVAGSAAYLTYLKKDEPSPRSGARQVATPARSEIDADRGAARGPVAHEPVAHEPTRTNEEVARKKEEDGRLDDGVHHPPSEPSDALGKNAPVADMKARPEPAPRPAFGFEPGGAKEDAAKSKDANLAVRDQTPTSPPPASTVTTAPPAVPAARTPASQPSKPQATPVTPAAEAVVEQRLRALEKQAEVVGGAAAGAVAGGGAPAAIEPSKLAEARPAETDSEDKLVGALDAREQQAEDRLFWMPPRTGLWSTGTAGQRDVTTPEPLKLISTEIEVRVGDTIARRVRQRFSNPSGQPVVATYSIGIAPGERAGDLSLTIGTTQVPPQADEAMAHVRVWQDLAIAGSTIDLTTLSPPRPLEGVANGSVRIRIPVPPPPAQATDDPPKLAIRLEPAQGYRLGQPSAAGLAITGHPLGSGAWDLTLPPTLGVKEDLLELDVPIVKSGG